VAQLTLFSSSGGVITDDDRGRIAYTPAFIDEATASAWYADLRESVEWRALRRQMYDREVDVPRLVSSYRLDPPPAATPRVILDAAERVTQAVGVAFNSVGLNRYRDGRDSVAPHNDHLDEIVEGCPIALVSLGTARVMTLRQKEPPRRATQLALEPGSLFVMDYATQLHYTHGIPKTIDIVGERISLAFRVKPPQRGG
jgi:alkylated DNA repair dioxygenase AlkB